MKRSRMLPGLAFAAVLLAGGTALAQVNQEPPPAKESAIPPRPVLEIMVKSTLAAFNNANLTGEYAVLHKLGTREFQREVPVQRLFAVFKPFRDQNLNIAPILIRGAIFTEEPRITNRGWLRLVGRFDTQPRPVLFRLQFGREEGAWRLVDINVSVPAAR